MSILKWLTGGDFASHKEEGERLLAAGNFGEARLAFQRALKKSGSQTPESITELHEKVQSCARQLALQRLENVREFVDSGDVERAEEMLNDALLISDHVDIKKEAERWQAIIEEKIAHDEGEENVEMSDDELLAVIAGAWSPDMAAEFSGYPEDFYRALMAAHDGNLDKALQILDSVAAEIDMDNALYFFLEKGRLQLISEDFDGAHASLTRFIAKVEEGNQEAIDELWSAYDLLSTVHSLRNDDDAAESALMKAYRAAPNNHVPLLHLGIFLRERGELARAKRTLENAMDMMGTIHPDMRVFRELGLTYLAMNERKDAIGYFKAVLDHVGHEQYDPEAALPLATIYEEDGKLQEASDIYRHLANGYDTANIFLYNLEAARLLRAQDAKESLVEEYLEVARSLASTDAHREALKRAMASHVS